VTTNDLEYIYILFFNHFQVNKKPFEINGVVLLRARCPSYLVKTSK